jgi:hypothetical protein
MAEPELFVNAAPLGPLYIALERFDAERGEEWGRYVAWSGLTQVQELVSLDTMLCPSVVGELIDTDWPHIVSESFMLDYFTDLDFLVERAGDLTGKNLLCVFRNPEAAPSFPRSQMRFELLGYELVDVTGAASPTTNCGGFPDIFSTAELNRYGLFDSIERAREVQAALYGKYQGRDHTWTHLWAVGRRCC